MRFSARDYRMPRYKEIPNVGLYLEQTVKYINECLAPIEISITPSMLSNYVKKGYIDRPIKKQYYADQIAYAIYIVIIKARHRHQAQVLTNGRMRLAMPMLSFVSPLQVPCPVHITVLLSLRTSMNTIIPAERYMF